MRFLVHLQIKPWEVDRLTVDQFDRCVGQVHSIEAEYERANNAK